MGLLSVRWILRTDVRFTLLVMFQASWRGLDDPEATPRPRVVIVPGF